MTLGDSEPTTGPWLLQLESGHHFYPADEGSELSEVSRHISFQFPGASGQWSPSWSLEHTSFRLAGFSPEGSLGWSGQASTFGMGFSTPDGSRFLLGPDLYEWRTSTIGSVRWTLGWKVLKSAETIRVTKGNEQFEEAFKQEATEAYLSTELDGHHLELRHGDDNNRRVRYAGPVWSVTAEQSRHSWPVLTAKWEGETASVRYFDWDYQSVSATYHPSHPWLKGVGGAVRRWQATTQVILPYNNTPGVVEAMGEVDVQDAWMDIARSQWRGRLVLRRAEPSGSGAHYSLYFPGVGERWPEPDIKHAWLIGGRLEREWPLGAHAGVGVWVQQWWPLAVNRKGNAENNDEVFVPRFNATKNNHSEADTNDTDGTPYRGMQLGISVRLY